jgi:hypothetical protein
MIRTFTTTCVGLALVGCLVLAGCGGPEPLSKANYDKIQNGMSPNDVGAIFGFPPQAEEDLGGAGEGLGGVGGIGGVGGLGGVTPPQGKLVSHNDIDRRTTYSDESERIDTFSTKELGGVNKKEIVVRYRDGKVEYKDQTNVQ